MATIVENLPGDRAISLGREELIRKMSFGSAWTQLRVAVWASIPGSSNISNAQLAIGVCHGTANGYRAALSDDALVVTFGPAEATYTYAAGPPPKYNGGSGGIGIVQRIGAATSTGTSVNSTAAYSASSLNPVLYFAHFLRSVSVGATFVRWTGAAPLTGTSIYSGTAHGFSRYASADWQRTWSGGSMEPPYAFAPGSQFTTFNPSGAGDWDCVTVSWTHDSPAMEINDLIVVRFSS